MFLYILLDPANFTILYTVLIPIATNWVMCFTGIYKLLMLYIASISYTSNCISKPNPFLKSDLHFPFFLHVTIASCLLFYFFVNFHHVPNTQANPPQPAAHPQDNYLDSLHITITGYLFLSINLIKQLISTFASSPNPSNSLSFFLSFFLNFLYVLTSIEITTHL